LSGWFLLWRDFGRPTAVGSRELDDCFDLEIARSSDDRIATYWVVVRPHAGYCIAPAEHRSRSWNQASPAALLLRDIGRSLRSGER